MKLGKKDFKFDKRTLQMADFLDTTLQPPTKFNFDKGRAPFKLRTWGNDDYGDCVFAAQMNQLLRNERFETRGSIGAEDQNVIDVYKNLTGCQQPDDANDNGYVMLDAMNWWRHTGWTVKKHTYTIEAFGQLDPTNHRQVKLATWLFHGVQFGFALPRTAQNQTHDGVWYVVPDAGSRGRPGSWGGHAVYFHGYDEEFMYGKTWGQNIAVTWEFIDGYADELWVPVDSLDKWRKHNAFDVDALNAYLDQIGARRR